MADIARQVKRGILRVIYNEAVKSGATLADALNEFLLAQSKTIEGGQVVTSSTNEGSSVTAQILKGYSPDEVFAFASELLDLYEAAKTAYGDDATDDTIFRWMMNSDTLNAPRDYGVGFSGMILQ